MSKTFRHRLLAERIGEVTVIRFVDSDLIEEAIIRDIADHLGALAGRPGPRKLVLDFRTVRFMSGRMLAVLVRVARRLEDGGGSVKLCGITAHLLAHFEITRLHRYFEIHREPSSALDAFARERARWHAGGPGSHERRGSAIAMAPESGTGLVPLEPAKPAGVT
jgi:anti-sigma B factor antagonist